MAVTLLGLDLTMNPATARQLVADGHIRALPEERILYLIKTEAKAIYDQQKLTPFFHARVCDGRNTLAYFICAVHQQDATQANLNGALNQNTAIAVQLPRLNNTTMLPLGYWDSLYYALIAEIRYMYDELRRRFGLNFERGDTVVHGYGTEGHTMWPLTAKAQAALLEAAWDTLMDPRLIAALDLAVRVKNMQTAANGPNATQFNSHAFQFPGLMSAAQMPPEEVMARLWEKHAPELDQASLVSFYHGSLLEPYQAEQQRQAATLKDHETNQVDTSCACTEDCKCRQICVFHAYGCPCSEARNDMSRIVMHHEALKRQLHDACDTGNRVMVNHLFGVHPGIAQMQIAAMARPSDANLGRAVQSALDGDRENHRMLDELRQYNAFGQNANVAVAPAPVTAAVPAPVPAVTAFSSSVPAAINTSIATVPANMPVPKLSPAPRPKTPARQNKDTFPLGFYGEGSGQRYPAEAMLRSDVSGYPPPGFGDGTYNTGVPARKPVPRSFNDVNEYGADGDMLDDGMLYGQAVTTPETGPSEHLSFPQVQPDAYTALLGSQNPFTQSFPGAVPYEGIPMSQAQFTQSFGATGRNPRMLEDNDFTDWKTSQANLLDFGAAPSYTPQRSSEQSTESFPPLSRQPTGNRPFTKVFDDLIEDPEQLEYAKTAAEEAYKPIELPLPDFIAPRPAKVQRYVSAGGNLPLAQREEIIGFDPKKPTAEQGFNISKDELLRQIDTSEHLNHNNRVQQAHETTSTPQSKRNSAEKSADKRDRNSSGGSRWVKRVFSRKNSECE